MLKWALIFLVVGIIASALGFSGAAGLAYGIAKVLGVLALALFAIFLVMGVVATNRVTS